MGQALVWISGASHGIGKAMATTVPWPDARVIDISRTGAVGVEHVTADLSDPASWTAVGESFRRELESFSGDRVVFVHSAGTIDPIGFAGEVDTGAYARSVLLNSAAPQVLGHVFLAAVRDVRARRHLVMLTSGAATSVYAGWSSYGAGKAAMDQWVRNVGAEQQLRGGVHVVAVTPGPVATQMQEKVRHASEQDFPERRKFVDLHERGRLRRPEQVAKGIWALLDADSETSPVLNLGEVVSPQTPLT